MRVWGRRTSARPLLGGSWGLSNNGKEHGSYYKVWGLGSGGLSK